MTAVTEILKAKGLSDVAVYAIAPTATVLEALQMMADKSVGALLVMEGEKIAGILTERDYARKIALMGRSSLNTLVRDVMTQNVM